MIDELNNLSDEELERKIEWARMWKGSMNETLYERFLRERERRKEQIKMDIEERRFRAALIKFEDIIRLLDSLANKPGRSIFWASLIAIAVGVAINLFTDLYRLLPLFHYAK